MRRQLRPMFVVGVVFALVASSCAGDRGERATTTTVSDSNPVIVDGDFGPDDMMALLYLLQQPEVRLAAVTVTGTGLAHCPDGAENAAAVLAHLGREDIPVACGEQETVGNGNTFPEEWRQAADGLREQLGLPPSDVDPGSNAVALIVETISGSSEPVRFLALGPLTNVARALKDSPEVASNIEHLYIMGGALDVPGSVPPYMTAEWNIWSDPRAAAEVLRTGIPITLVGLDATNDVPATRFFYEALEAQRDSPAGEMLYRYLTANQGILAGGTYFFWDPLAAVTLVDPDVVDTERRSVAIVESQGSDEGATVESADGVEVEVAIEADRSRFEAAFLTALNDGTPVEANIPAPDLTVTFDGSRCTFEGPTSFESAGATTRVVVELVNESELGLSLASGLHEGYSWDRLIYDVARVDTEGPPEYWELTGEVTIEAKTVSGGHVTGALDLAPGAHALACATSDSRVFLLTEVVVEG
ncbi:MAG TPA: nucleoside hydrolase [Acidimicrobiia bacterium]|nr:nucleoside hydrolase [Acidimicrobiia bacterium]